MNRHASLDELARLGADDLRPRKAARISQHLAECPQCTQTNGQISEVPILLSSVQFSAMPESLSGRIDSALAAEAAQRVAEEPATEAGRRDLPARSAAPSHGRPRFIRPHSARIAWGMPVPAARVLATAAAILVVGIGGYVIASHSGGAAAPSSAGRAAAPAELTPITGQASTGPAVTYRQGGSVKSIPTVTSDTNFKAATLADQAAVAVSEAKIDGVRSIAVKSSGVNTSLAAPTDSVTNASGMLGVHASPSTASQLTSCVDRVIGPRQVVLLVERARFDGRPATIIVTVPASASETSGPKKAQIWAVGQTCSATTSDVLDHVKVARL